MKFFSGLIVIILLFLLLSGASGCNLKIASRLKPATTAPSEGPAVLPRELLETLDFAVPREGPTKEWERARRHFFQAYILQLQGKLGEAIDQYQRSINALPTAEAYTFLGWTYSWMERYEDATQEALKAITLDPEYGNPYNDIGVYLMKQGKLDEAIPWLKRAMQAKRYASPHYPWLNLGHIWVLKGEWSKALSSYQEIWRLSPDYPVPPVPTLPAALIPPQPDAINKELITQQQAVRDAVNRYFHAWNNYDARALQDLSAPPGTEMAQALLLHLAAARHLGMTAATKESRVIYLQGDTAIAGTDIVVRGKSREIYHLLRRVNGTWKVVIRLLTEQPIPKERMSMLSLLA